MRLNHTNSSQPEYKRNDHDPDLAEQKITCFIRNSNGLRFHGPAADNGLRR